MKPPSLQRSLSFGAALSAPSYILVAVGVGLAQGEPMDNLGVALVTLFGSIPINAGIHWLVTSRLASHRAKQRASSGTP